MVEERQLSGQAQKMRKHKISRAQRKEKGHQPHINFYKSSSGESPEERQRRLMNIGLIGNNPLDAMSYPRKSHYHTGIKKEHKSLGLEIHSVEIPGSASYDQRRQLLSESGNIFYYKEIQFSKHFSPAAVIEIGDQLRELMAYQNKINFDSYAHIPVKVNGKEIFVKMDTNGMVTLPEILEEKTKRFVPVRTGDSNSIPGFRKYDPNRKAPEKPVQKPTQVSVQSGTLTQRVQKVEDIPAVSRFGNMLFCQDISFFNAEKISGGFNLGEVVVLASQLREAVEYCRAASIMRHIKVHEGDRSYFVEINSYGQVGLPQIGRGWQTSYEKIDSPNLIEDFIEFDELDRENAVKLLLNRQSRH